MYGFSEITPDELEQWRAEGRAFRLVDVRQPGETGRGVIPGAELVPLAAVPPRKDEFTEDEVPVVFYCQSGARSAQACAFMSQQGVEGVYNLRGGIMGWAQSGRSIVTPD
ncbi:MULTISPECIES: rhodanese-like domain-containing protein [unclassified Thioalkalivibrio]|uniref:rhodanese-like domain-containing protein n=1 Tax=unclassified Thioalkalivibrio TaxID=2621013 RepID=UPI0003645CA7|nr:MULTISPECIES: rhodanese-like domain-containing protein [unclassified Thioalkalivibrio]